VIDLTLSDRTTVSTVDTQIQHSLHFNERTSPTTHVGNEGIERSQVGTALMAVPEAPADWTKVGPTVSVVIPTLNESKNLQYVLGRIPSIVSEVIIVDGHSTDETVETALSLRPDIKPVIEMARGKGRALAAGFRAASGDIIVMLDADGSTDPAEIPRFVAALTTGADFAKGTRFVTGGGSEDITPIRRLGNFALSGLVNMLFGSDYSDLCYGYNAFWKRCLDVVQPDCAGFEVETLLNIRAISRQLNVIEVPSFEANRRSGVSNLDARRDGIRILRTIVAEWLRPR
jgi:glycosyltransferase involved in cell wall biosynthesis